ncbi:MAG: methyltransferase domain-containing protein [Rhodomicrobium sp.]|nr:methyltransferase domain-containing protein [Rhodomicrobium sp.]
MDQRLPHGRTPHYVREYQNLVRHLARTTEDPRELAERAVGGAFKAVGAMQAELIMEFAPGGAFTLVDVGCGSGRTATALKSVDRLRYIGTDVVPELLDYARKAAGRPDWRFETVSSLAIPAEDESADIVQFMSVFTHLTDAEVGALLDEAARVLKPGGALIASFLDREEKRHVAMFRPPWRQRVARLFRKDVMISFTTEAAFTRAVEARTIAVSEVRKGEKYGHHILIGRKKG